MYHMDVNLSTLPIDREIIYAGNNPKLSQYTYVLKILQLNRVEYVRVVPSMAGWYLAWWGSYLARSGLVPSMAGWYLAWWGWYLA